MKTFIAIHYPSGRIMIAKATCVDDAVRLFGAGDTRLAELALGDNLFELPQVPDNDVRALNYR